LSSVQVLRWQARSPDRSITSGAFHQKDRSEKEEEPMVAQNRICHPTSATTEAPVPAQTLAELLRDLGLVLRRRFRHGAGLERAALLLQSLRWENKLALAFVNLRSSVQLRAMVEDWPLQCIQEAIQEQRLETLPLQAGHTRRVGRQAADLENKRLPVRAAGKEVSSERHPIVRARSRRMKKSHRSALAAGLRIIRADQLGDPSAD
jgi:hypothetical protein